MIMAGRDPASALLELEYEPDPPIFTPRITAIIGQDKSLLISSAYRPVDNSPGAERLVIRCTELPTGSAMVLTTYAGGSRHVSVSREVSRLACSEDTGQELIELGVAGSGPTPSCRGGARPSEWWEGSNRRHQQSPHRSPLTRLSPRSQLARSAPPPLRAVGYIRVSTAEQASSELGMEAQRTAITTACTQRGWLLEECFEDAGVSSVARHRPGLAAALAAVRAREADAIVVAKLDRLARSALHAATLFADAAKNNWELIIVDVDASTAGGRFMRNVMAAAAEYEHELIAARTRDALAAARARGIQLGRPRDIEPDVEDRIVSLRKRSRLSARAIAKRLESAHVLSPRGSERWHPATITRVLRRHGVSFDRGRTRDTGLKHP